MFTISSNTLSLLKDDEQLVLPCSQLTYHVIIPGLFIISLPILISSLDSSYLSILLKKDIL